MLLTAALLVSIADISGLSASAQLNFHLISIESAAIESFDSFHCVTLGGKYDGSVALGTSTCIIFDLAMLDCAHRPKKLVQVIVVDVIIQVGNGNTCDLPASSHSGKNATTSVASAHKSTTSAEVNGSLLFFVIVVVV